MFNGQPIPSTEYAIRRAKISDGKSVRVTLPELTKIEAEKFYLMNGFFGVAMQEVETLAGEATTKIVLNIEQCEYETDQAKITDVIKNGDTLYWNDTEKVITVVKTGNRKVGKATKDKLANETIITLILSAQE